MARTAKYTFWAIDGVRYGRVKTFPTPASFLERIYGVTEEEDADHAFYSDWKEAHPLQEFIRTETPKVERHWFRYSFSEYGTLALGDAKPGTKGAFELWLWDH